MSSFIVCFLKTPRQKTSDVKLDISQNGTCVATSFNITTCTYRTTGPWRSPTASKRGDLLLKLNLSAKRKEEANLLEASEA